MPAPDATRARLIAGGAGIAATAMVAAVIVQGAGSLRPVAVASGAAAIAAAVVCVAGGWPSLGVVTAILLGAGFTAGRVGEPRTLDARTAPVAVGLLVIAELLAWAAEARTARPPGTPAAVRLQRLAVMAGAGGLATVLVTAAATGPRSTDLAVAALGVAAMALTATLVVALVRERVPPT